MNNSRTNIRSIPRLALFLLAMMFVSSAEIVAQTADSIVFTQVFSDTSKKDAVLTSDVDLKSVPGSIVLSPGDQKNLATSARILVNYVGTLPPSNDPQKPDTTKMNPNNLRDNNFFSMISFPTPNNIGSTVKIDLNGIRKVNKITAVNLGNTPFSYNTRPVAFSYYAGIDSNRLARVFQEFNNTDSARHTAFISDPQPVRYLSFVIDKQDPRNATVISEFQIFGEGYVEEGVYVSAVDSVGTSPANFARVALDADIPEGTSLAISFRTGTKRTVDSLSWSGWSDPVVFSSKAAAQAGGKITVAEPRRYFKYRIKLLTSNLLTPTVRSISIVYQKNLVLDSTSVTITPSDVPVLSPVTLTYSIATIASPASLGIDTIRISTPSPCVVRSLSMNGVNLPYSYTPSPDKMVIAFPTPMKSSGTLNITFSTKLITAGSFPAEIVSRSSPWNPQRLDPMRTAAGDAWSVSATGVPATPLVDVRIDPNPFTPNNDGKNDATIIDFSVANISTAKPLRIMIYDLNGRKVRTVADQLSGINPFFGDPRTGGKGFLWDGRDDEGKKLLPGVYIIQVSLDVDNGGQFITKTVVIAY